MRQHRLGLGRAASLRKLAGSTPMVSGTLVHSDGAPAHRLRFEVSLDLGGRDHPLGQGVSGPDGSFSVPVRLPALALRKHVQIKVLALRPALSPDEPLPRRWTVVARARSAPLADLAGVDLGDVVIHRWRWRQGPVPRLHIDPDDPADLPSPEHATARDARWAAAFAAPPRLRDTAAPATPDIRLTMLVDVLGAGVHLHLERVATAALRHLRPGPVFDLLMPHLHGIPHTNALAESWAFGGGGIARLGLDREAVALRLTVSLGAVDALGRAPLTVPTLPSLDSVMPEVREAMRRVLLPRAGEIETAWVEVRRFSDEILTREPTLPAQTRLGVGDAHSRTPAFRGHRPGSGDLERLCDWVAALWIRATVEASRARAWLADALSCVDGSLVEVEPPGASACRAAIAAALRPGLGPLLLDSPEVDARLKDVINSADPSTLGIAASQIEVAPWG